MSKRDFKKERERATREPPKEVKKTEFEKLTNKELIDSVLFYEEGSALVKELVRRFKVLQTLDRADLCLID